MKNHLAGNESAVIIVVEGEEKRIRHLRPRTRFIRENGSTEFDMSTAFQGRGSVCHDFFIAIDQSSVACVNYQKAESISQIGGTMRDEAELLQTARSDFAARGRRFGLLERSSRWRRRAKRAGIALLIVGMMVCAAEFVHYQPPVRPPGSPAMWLVLPMLAISCVIGGFWGGALGLATAFGLSAWPLLGRPLNDEAWIWWT